MAPLKPTDATGEPAEENQVPNEPPLAPTTMSFVAVEASLFAFWARQVPPLRVTVPLPSCLPVEVEPSAVRSTPELIVVPPDQPVAVGVT